MLLDIYSLIFVYLRIVLSFFSCIIGWFILFLKYCGTFYSPLYVLSVFFLFSSCVNGWFFLYCLLDSYFFLIYYGIVLLFFSCIVEGFYSFFMFCWMVFFFGGGREYFHQILMHGFTLFLMISVIFILSSCILDVESFLSSYASLDLIILNFFQVLCCVLFLHFPLVLFYFSLFII